MCSASSRVVAARTTKARGIDLDHDSLRRRVYRRDPASFLDAASGAGRESCFKFHGRTRKRSHGSDVPVDGRSADARSGAGLWGLALGSIGVVYGDIGTSPLYALREAVVAASGPSTSELTRETVLGVVSLILWALIVVVTLKYVLMLLRADNNGEGGTLTLMALASRAVGRIGKAATPSRCSASSAPLCFTAMPSSRRRCRFFRRSKVSMSPCRRSTTSSCR